MEARAAEQLSRARLLAHGEHHVAMHEPGAMLDLLPIVIRAEAGAALAH
jgi:hypothetical protein